MSEAATTPDPWDEETPTEQTAPADVASEGSSGSDGVNTPADSAEAEKEPPKPTKKAAAKKTATVPKAGLDAEADRPKPTPPPVQPSTSAAAVSGLGSTLADLTTYVIALLWGPEGTGKTTSALRMTEIPEAKANGLKVMLIDVEGGAKVRALKQQGVDVSRIEVWPRPEDGGPSAISFEGLYDLALELRKRSQEYVGWVWDSGSEMTKRLLDQVTAEARAKDERIGKERGRFQINLEDHGVASSMLRELLRMYRDLPMHGVITALERRDTDNDTGRVKYGPAMAPAMANDAAGLVDIVMFMEIEEVNGTEVRTGKTTPTRIRRAKDRFGVLPKKMPDPFMDRIVAYVNDELSRETDPVLAEIRKLAKPEATAEGDTKKENA